MLALSRTKSPLFRPSLFHEKAIVHVGGEPFGSRYPFGAMSSTLMATTSQPRNLLSIARLNMARSRIRPSNSNRVLIDQTCFGRSGGLAPISLPLFQGVRLLGGAQFSMSDMIVLLCYEDDEHAPPIR